MASHTPPRSQLRTDDDKTRPLARALRWLRRGICCGLAAVVWGCGPEKPAETRCFTVDASERRNVLSIDERYLSEVQREAFYLHFFWKDLRPDPSFLHNLETSGRLQIFTRGGTGEQFSGYPKTLLGIEVKSELHGWTKYKTRYSDSVQFLPRDGTSHIRYILCVPDMHSCDAFIETRAFRGALIVPDHQLKAILELADRAEELVGRFEAEALNRCSTRPGT